MFVQILLQFLKSLRIRWNLACRFFLLEKSPHTVVGLLAGLEKSWHTHMKNPPPLKTTVYYRLKWHWVSTRCQSNTTSPNSSSRWMWVEVWITQKHCTVEPRYLELPRVLRNSSRWRGFEIARLASNFWSNSLITKLTNTGNLPSSVFAVVRGW